MGWDGHVGMILMMSVWAGRHLQWQNSKTDQLETSVTLCLEKLLLLPSSIFFNERDRERERARERGRKSFLCSFARLLLLVSCYGLGVTCRAMLPLAVPCCRHVCCGCRVCILETLTHVTFNLLSATVLLSGPSLASETTGNLRRPGNCSRK